MNDTVCFIKLCHGRIRKVDACRWTPSRRLTRTQGKRSVGNAVLTREYPVQIKNTEWREDSEVMCHLMFEES